ncbi:DUF6453 family protein [Citrobacter sp. Igbk 16]|uniref:DUF6453 family protein n=1 Tax=Citrobacter sp. Igbk 16 TaxID=2963958 RepID=UPI0023037FF6|nr:DUF6453 family protein [Citrobacter sp. Igbk 16]MDA8518957.1 DUF6453 family protein [Citrobacter sp. Igbk 16]
MPEGILIDYNDGRQPMHITTGMRAPAYCGALTQSNRQVTDRFGNGAITFPAPSNPGSQLMFLATNPVMVYQFGPLPEIYYITAIQRNDYSNLVVPFNNKGGGGNRSVAFDGLAFEVLPASSYNEGLFVSDSTNFTAISNVGTILTCAWSGSLYVNGQQPLPVGGVPFCRWDNPNVSVGFDGTNLVVRDITYGGRDDVAGATNIEVVIFNQTPPQPSEGITMYNAAGQCTFSTAKKPFLFDSTIQITDSNQWIGDKFINVCYTGAQVRMIGGFGNGRYKGLVRTGGNVRSTWNKVFGGTPSNGWDASFNMNISMPMVLLPSMY